MNKKINNITEIIEKSINTNITNNYRKVLALLLATMLVLVGLTGCGEEKTTAPAAPVENKATPAAPPAQVRDISIEPGTYKVIENFNVGENIYVRSMIIDKTTQSLWVGTSIGVIK